MRINEEKYTPLGIVEVEDIETGEIVYTTHNMIVKSGREKILDQIFPTNGSYSTTLCSKFFETNHRHLTVPEMEIVMSSENITDPSTQCDYSDMQIQDVADNNDKSLSEIVLSTKSYKIDKNDGRTLWVRTTGESDVQVESGTYNPSADSEQTVLGDNQSLVIKFTDGQDRESGKINQIYHICCSNANGGNPTKAITAVGLAFKRTTDNNTWHLFSRAAIDPIFMRPGRKYVMHYTLHF